MKNRDRPGPVQLDLAFCESPGDVCVGQTATPEMGRARSLWWVIESSSVIATPVQLDLELEV